jgi:alginate O-acetyltransferase complex protein AlgI
MIYTTPLFICLLLFTVAIYALCRSGKGRFRVLLASSALYYLWAGWFDALILVLVMLVSWSAVAFSVKFPRRRKTFVTAGVVVVVLHLLTWKYLSWGVSQIQMLFPGFLGGTHLALALPLGISFYTFQKIAYLVDFYDGEAEAVGLGDFLLFNGFFAQLIAGPITRASALVPQIQRLQPLRIDGLYRGSLLFVLGFVKKAAIGDNLAVYVNPIFASPASFPTWQLVLGVAAFASQLWADFSGYTDMGRGAAMMFGISLPENFIAPFLSRGPREFWRRWHITLSEWIRDYLYIPLAARARSPLGLWVAVFITMLLAGLWHGAGWNFMIYGLYWGALLVGEHLWRRARQRSGIRESSPGSIRWIGSVLVMYLLVLISRLLFRSAGLPQLWAYVTAMRANSGIATFYPGYSWVLWLIAATFLIQILEYRPLEEGAIPLWRRLLERLNRKGVSLEAWPAGAQSVAGLAFGVFLGAIIIASVMLQVEGLSREFLYFRF